jgi:plasmid stabilization system protein ParE
VDVEFGAHAEDEFLEALGWYAARDWDVAMRFDAEVRRAAALVGDRPRLWAEIEPGARRALLRGFPYSLIYCIEPRHVLIVAVMHQRRHPGYWRGRK